MITQGFGLKDWYFIVYYDVREGNLPTVHRRLVKTGDKGADEACEVLGNVNCGYTFTNFRKHITIIALSQTDSAEEMYDSISHETRHAADHLSEFYDLDPWGEKVAYLQGEIARRMFPAAAMVICGGA